MQRTTVVLRCLFLLVLVSPLWVATAQFSWPRTSDGQSVRAEFMIPSLDSRLSDHYSAYVISLDGRIKSGESTFIVAEIPIASSWHQSSGSLASTRKTALANIYVGLEWAVAGSLSFGEMGIQLPTLARENGAATELPAIGDLNRLEMYMPNCLSVRGAYNYRMLTDAGLSLLVRIGPSLLFPTGDTFTKKTQALLDYGLGGGFENETVRVGIGIFGRTMLTDEYLMSHKKALHSLQLGANMRFGTVRPGLFVRLPLESEIGDLVDATLGFFVSIGV